MRSHKINMMHISGASDHMKFGKEGRLIHETRQWFKTLI